MPIPHLSYKVSGRERERRYQDVLFPFLRPLLSSPSLSFASPPKLISSSFREERLRGSRAEMRRDVTDWKRGTGRAGHNRISQSRSCGRPSSFLPSFLPCTCVNREANHPFAKEGREHPVGREKSKMSHVPFSPVFPSRNRRTKLVTLLRLRLRLRRGRT